MKRSHVMAFIPLCVMWQCDTAISRHVPCAVIPVQVHSDCTKGFSQPILLIISLSQESGTFGMFSPSQKKAHYDYKGYASPSKHSFLSYVSQNFLQFLCYNESIF